MKIYTKTGDKGETGIIGKRISKASRLIDALGSLDELNAAIGVVIAEMDDITEDRAEGANLKEWKKLTKELEDVQKIIFSIGGLLANGNIKIDFKKETKTLEKAIDRMDTKLRPLQNFILPGGSEAAAHTHLSRAICRRAERRLVEYFEEITSEHEEVLPYINRLSDYFFTLARYINKLEDKTETIWNSRK